MEKQLLFIGKEIHFNHKERKENALNDIYQKTQSSLQMKECMHKQLLVLGKHCVDQATVTFQGIVFALCYSHPQSQGNTAGTSASD